MSAKPTLVIEGGCVVTGDAKDPRFERADIVIAGNAIAAIGPDAGSAHPGIERIDARIQPRIQCLDLDVEPVAQRVEFGVEPIHPRVDPLTLLL